MLHVFTILQLSKSLMFEKNGKNQTTSFRPPLDNGWPHNMKFQNFQSLKVEYFDSFKGT